MARAHKAGAMDVRNIIGALLGLYGVILTLMGLFGDKQYAKTGDINANLIAGICLLVVAGVFLAWAKARPIIIPADYVEEHQREATEGTPGQGPGL